MKGRELGGLASFGSVHAVPGSTRARSILAVQRAISFRFSGKDADCPSPAMEEIVRYCVAAVLLIALHGAASADEAPVSPPAADPAVEMACEATGEPVCGYDGAGERVTYANLCRAATVGATDVTSGGCQSSY
jgi:hypothetical protein